MAKRANGQMVFGAVLGGILLTALFIWAFVWYAGSVIPHTYPTIYTTFFWGLIHGLFIVPTFFWSLFAHSVTIYQAPNNGNWYNIGYFIGISIILGGSHGARSKAPKKSK